MMALYDISCHNIMILLVAMSAIHLSVRARLIVCLPVFTTYNHR